MGQEPFGFPPSFAPGLTATRVEGGARSLSTDLVLPSWHRPELRSASTLAACDLVSHLFLGVDTDDRFALGHDLDLHSTITTRATYSTVGP